MVYPFSRAERIEPKLARWLRNLEEYVRHNERNNEQKQQKPGRRTKVAILDNGILSIPPTSQNIPLDVGFDQASLSLPPVEKIGENGNHDIQDRSVHQADQIENDKSLWSRIKAGRSFVEGESTISPWLFASNPHGTQMANMICAIDPFCEIYIARVAEDAYGVTPKRVQKVCCSISFGLIALGYLKVLIFCAVCRTVEV
jgi:hypothetical protein